MKNTLAARKSIEKAIKDKKELAEMYGVSESAVVWMGGNKYIVVMPDGTEVKI